MTRRPQVWIPVVTVVGVAWVVAAFFLYRTSVPGLSLPTVDPGDYWSAHELDRAASFERFLTVDSLLALVAGLVALFVVAVRAPGFAGRTGLGPIGAGIIVGMVTLAVLWAVGVPFQIAAGWWYRHHELSQESYAEWIFGPWAQLGFDVILSLFLIAVTMALARGISRLWWLAGAPVFVAVAVFFAFVSPYLDLTEQRPAETVAALARDLPEIEERTGAGPTDVRIAHMSDVTTLVNGYTAGLGPSERVVIWDTFLDAPYSSDEVEVVVAHELGHAASAHVLKGLAWFALFAFPLAFGVAELTHRRGGMGLPGNVPLAALVLVIFAVGLTPVQNAVTRRYEAEADWIALQATRDPGSARELFTTFVTTDLEDPEPSFWEQQLFGSHPSVADRIAMVNAWEERGR